LRCDYFWPEAKLTSNVPQAKTASALADAKKSRHEASLAATDKSELSGKLRVSEREREKVVDENGQLSIRVKSLQKDLEALRLRVETMLFDGNNASPVFGFHHLSTLISAI
jgi:hypothetical protein